MIEYKSDGEIKKKTLGELKQSAAGQDYIQKGMAENAKVRKEAEALAQQATQERRNASPNGSRFAAKRYATYA